MLRRSLSSLALALIAGPCAAAAITVTANGTASAAAGSTTLVITTTAACASGSMEMVFAADLANTAVNTAADNAGNAAYQTTVALTLTGNVARMKMFYTRPGSFSAIPNGGQITLTYNATTGVKLAAAACVTGLMLTGGGNGTGGGVSDQVNNVGATGTSTAPSFSGGTLLSSSEIIVGGVVLPTGVAATYTEASGYTPISNVTNIGGLWWAYKLSADTSAPTYAPTISPTQVWGDNIATYQAARTDPPWPGWRP